MKKHNRIFNVLREPAAMDMTIGDPPKEAFGAKENCP